MPDQLFLCFNGDGPYWSDFVRSISYPSGFSYTVYPFRYATDLVGPSLAAELQAANGARDMWIALTVVGTIANFADIVKDISGGKPVDRGLYKFYLPLSAVASAFAALAVFLLQEKVKNRAK